ncbi:MAG: DNA internalization-related competence protein ComEC/Rec2 [Firmicutes bacterium]|nr:DNA internalization-related competence protein ComEC/Rec2 [Bacillota bacterium]
MRKRPLGFWCLVVTVLLYLFVRERPIPYTNDSAWQGKSLTVTGKVYRKETVIQRTGPVSVLYLELIQENRTGYHDGKIICYLKAGQTEPEMGSCVKLCGKPKLFERASNPGQFDLYSFYQISGISYRLNQAEILAKTTEYNHFTEMLYQARCFLAKKLESSLPEKEAAIMCAILLGTKSGMDREIKMLYQQNGIAHILAISGLHVSMLGMGLYRLLRKWGVPMKEAAACSAAAMLLYGAMVGFSVSAVRAILMFAIHMFAVICERTYDMLTAVSVAAVLVLLEQPLYFFHSGFIFSFGCVAGIGTLLPALTEGSSLCREKGSKWTRRLIKGLLTGVGMSVITLPVNLWFYYQFPVYSVFLNLLIIPLMSLLVMAGLALIAVQFLHPLAAVPFAFVVQGILKLYEIAMKLCNKLPGRLWIAGQPKEWQVLVYLFLLTAVVVFRKQLKLLTKWVVVAVAMIVLCIRTENRMELTFLDVGQGDCIFVGNANGDNYLVDGGSSSVSEVGIYRIIPFLKSRGVHRLKAVFVTHPDEDHCNGIRELLADGKKQGIFIENLVLPDVEEEEKSQGYLELERLALDADIPVRSISAGQEITDGRLKFICLNPSKDSALTENEYSVVLQLYYENFSAVLTGDVEGKGEQEMLRCMKERGADQVTVLKAAHHGSAYSTPEELLNIITPVYTVVSCGQNNSYGHPHKELLERLINCKTNTIITYEAGAVTFWTDGNRVEVKKYLEK